MGPGSSPDPSGSSVTISTSESTGAPSPVITRLPCEGSSITKIWDQLDDTNWVIWQERIHRIFALCGVEPYVYGTIPRPSTAYLESQNAWDGNDVYAQILITNSLGTGQMVHVSRLNTANEIWRSLEAIHETHDYQVAIAIQRTLFGQRAAENNDIVEHLTQLKKQWERLNVLDDEDFRITDIQFKTIIASLLPQSWDAFTEPYVGCHKGTIETDPKKLASSQEFIGIIKEESIRQKVRIMNKVKPATPQAYYVQPPNQSHSLAERIRDPTKAANVYSSQFCRNCRQNNHITDNCRWLGKLKCDKCGWFGHVGADCRQEPQKRKASNEGGGKPKGLTMKLNKHTSP